MSLTEEKKISKFIYFYSDLYEFYNVHLQERLKGIFDISAMNTMPESLKLIFVYMSICLTFLLFCILVVFLYLKSKKIREYDFILLSLISIFLFESLLIILGSSEVFGGRYAVVPGFILILIVFRINFSKTCLSGTGKFGPSLRKACLPG